VTAESKSHTVRAVDAWYRHTLVGFSAILLSLSNETEHPDISAEEYHNALQTAVDRYGIVKPKEIGEKFGVSVSTVMRWVSGQSAPHPVVRPIILRWLRECLEQKIAETHGDQNDVLVVEQAIIGKHALTL
jgi:hypothetical protein